MDKLGQIVKKRLNQHKLGDSARASEILHLANLSLQKKLDCSDDEVRAFRLKDGALYVGTAGSVWSQEVFHQREELMDEIRQKHGQKAVSRIVIKGLTSS